VKNLDPEIKMNVSSNVSTIIKQVLPESENTEEVEGLFLSGLEQYKESQPKPDETEPVPSTVVTVSVVEKEKVKPKLKEKESLDEVSEEAEEVGEEDEEDGEKEVVDAVEEITEMIEEAKIVDDGVEEKVCELLSPELLQVVQRVYEDDYIAFEKFGYNGSYWNERCAGEWNAKSASRTPIHYMGASGCAATRTEIGSLSKVPSQQSSNGANEA